MDSIEEIETNFTNNTNNNLLKSDKTEKNEKNSTSHDDKQELEMIKELNIKAVNLIIKNKFEEALILLKKLEDIFEVYYSKN